MVIMILRSNAHRTKSGPLLHLLRGGVSGGDIKPTAVHILDEWALLDVCLGSCAIVVAVMMRSEAAGGIVHVRRASRLRSG